MKKYIILIIFNFILLIAQTSFMPEFLGTHLTPNLILAFSYSFILADLDDMALQNIFIGALLLDFTGLGIIGLRLTYFLVLFMLVVFLKKTFIKGIVFQFSMLAATVLLEKLIFYGVGFDSIITLVYSALFTIFTSFVFFLLILRLQRRFISAEYRIRV